MTQALKKHFWLLAHGAKRETTWNSDISVGLSLINISKVSSFFNKSYQTNILIDGSLGVKLATGEHTCASEITFPVGPVRQTKASCYRSKLVVSFHNQEAKTQRGCDASKLVCLNNSFDTSSRRKSCFKETIPFTLLIECEHQIFIKVLLSET